MGAEEFLVMVAMLLVFLAWRPKPTDPCRWCHEPENRRDGCRQWCGAYREWRDCMAARNARVEKSVEDRNG
jgi:hypothetical protein